MVHFVVAASFLSSLALAAPGAPGLIINEDNSHFFGSRSAEEMTLEGLNAFIDQYAGTKVSHLFLNPSAMRTSYASGVWDSIWDLGDQKIPEGNEFCRKWVENARLLHERGLDPYAVWIARCREKGISPWLSMRMNDVHDVSDTTNFMHSTFWLKHPEYWRVPGSTGSWVDRALDYGQPEVRAHSMALVEELLARYDPDGLELDWMRFGYHFRPGHEEEGRAILTEFMRTVRRLTQSWSERRGHPIRFGARVPAHPDAAAGLGMDGVTWVQEGVVDMLVPTPFWATADFDIPVELWRTRIGPAASKVVLAAGQEILLRAYPSAPAVENDLQSARGFAAGAYHRGADQIYLFNYMDPAPMQGGREAYRTLLEQGLSPKSVGGQARRYVVTYRDTVPPGVSNDAQLPAKVLDHPQFRVYVGPRPRRGRITFLAGLVGDDKVGRVTCRAIMNGAPCTPLPDLEHPEAFPGVTRALSFDCPLHAARAGYNAVQLLPAADSPDGVFVWSQLIVNK